MSDDHSQSSSPKQKKVIKIGSQRPGYVPDAPKDKPPQMPLAPKKETPKLRMAADPQAHQPVAPASAPVPVAATPPPAAVPADTPAADTTPLVPDAPAQTGAEEIETISATAAFEPETELAVELPDVADIKLDMSDEELEQEIAAAMGQDVEHLMADQVQPATDVEVQLDGRYKATVLRIFRESVLFDLPGPYNGSIPLRHFEANPEPGAEFEVVVTNFSADEQMYDCLLPGGSVEVLDWSDVQEGVVVEATITGHNKGGLECEVNRIRGFIPASQISLYRVDDLESFVGQKFQCVVTEAKPEKRNLVLSHRAVLEREREEAREKLLAELAIGQIHEGTVTRIQNFGAFVDIGGIDGLIHISQLSWDNIRHPSEVVSEGQQVRVRIEKLDLETGKIGLSYRDLMHHPWEGIEAKYPVGEIVTGTVSKIMDFGAFVKLESGVEGLVHISELSHKRVNRVSHVVEEGQRVEVKIVSVDADAQRISLSMKATQAGGSGDDTSTTEAEEQAVRHVPKTPAKMLKGGTSGKKSDGDKFGLKW